MVLIQIVHTAAVSEVQCYACERITLSLLQQGYCLILIKCTILAFPTHVALLRSRNLMQQGSQHTSILRPLMLAFVREPGGDSLYTSPALYQFSQITGCNIREVD
ncbi:hypothetical protein D3C85_1492720 [compost metagenome]